MHPIMFDIGEVTSLYPMWLVAGVIALIFFSWGLSYGQAKKWNPAKAFGLGLIFAIVGGGVTALIALALGVPRVLEPKSPFPIRVYSYGLMLVVAFIVGTIVAIRRGKQEKISADTVLDIVIYIIIGAIIGARLLYVLLKYDQYVGHWSDIYKITQGGLSVHGGVIGGMIAGWLYTAPRKISFWKIADLFAPSMALGMAFGRVGCFLNGCCYGVICPATAWYAVTFPPNPHTDITADPRHPAQLYMLILNLVIFFYLNAMYKNKKFDGHVFFMWLALFSIARFIQEFARFDASSDVLFGMITVAQLASIFLAIIAFVVIFEMKKRREMSERIAAQNEPKKE